MLLLAVAAALVCVTAPDVDTLVVRDGNVKTVLRLAEIDAPDSPAPKSTVYDLDGGERNRREGGAVKRIVLVGSFLVASNVAVAANPACEAQATERKLSGAAKTSFVAKCEKDARATAQTTCDAQAADKKLSGAAKTSFTKKCVSDAASTAK